jgi:O-antigen/teichoic acid export membrane protein
MPINDKNNAITLLAIRLTGTGLAFGTNVYVSRAFGANGMGLYSLFLSFIAGFVMLAKLGTDNLAVKYTAIFHQRGDQPLLLGTWAYFSTTLLLASIVLIVFIAFFGDSILASFISTENIAFVRFALILSLIPTGLFTLNLGVLRGLNKVLVASCIEMLLMPGSILLALVCIPFLFQISTPDKLPIYAYLTATIITAIVALTSAYGSLAPKLPLKFPTVAPLVREGWYILGISIIDFFTNWLATYVVASHMNESAVGIFSTCWRLMIVVAMPKLIFDQINAPIFAQLYAKGDLKGLEARVRTTASVGLIIGCITFLFIWIFAPAILHLFGNEFVAGQNALRIMALGQSLSLCCGSVGYLLIMTNEGKLFRNINLAILLAQACLLPLLVDNMQALGAAIGASAAVAANNIVAAYWSQRRLKIRVTPSIESLRSIWRDHILTGK